MASSRQLISVVLGVLVFIVPRHDDRHQHGASALVPSLPLRHSFLVASDLPYPTRCSSDPNFVCYKSRIQFRMMSEDNMQQRRLLQHERLPLQQPHRQVSVPHSAQNQPLFPNFSALDRHLRKRALRDWRNSQERVVQRNLGGTLSLQHAAEYFVATKQWSSALRLLNLTIQYSSTPLLTQSDFASVQETAPIPRSSHVLYDVYGEFTSVGFATFRLVISSAAKAGRLKHALSALDVMCNEYQRLQEEAQRRSQGCSSGAKLVEESKFDQLCQWHMSEHVFALVLNACSDRGRMDLAARTLAMMNRVRIPMTSGEAGRIEPTALTYSILIKGYGRQGAVDAVEQVLDKMRRLHVEPDTVLLNTAVDAFVRCGRLSSARAVVSAMHRQATAAARVFGCAAFAAADETILEVERTDKERRQLVKIAPDTRTYNTLIKGVGAAAALRSADGGEMLKQVFALQKEMTELAATTGAHCAPNSVTINSMIDACVRAGSVQRALQLISETEAAVDALDQVAPPGSEMGGGGRRRKQQKYKRRRRGSGNSARVGLGVGVEGYTTVIAALADSDTNGGGVEAAMQLLKHAEARGVVFNEVTYTALLSAYARAPGMLAEARELFHLMDTSPELRHARPNAVTYNAMIHAVCTNFMAGQREGLLKNKEKDHGGGDHGGGEPGGNPASKLAEAKQLVAAMRRAGFGPNTVTMNTMMRCLVQFGDEADSIVSGTEQSIGCGCHVRNMERAEELLTVMDTSGPQPDAVTIATLIDGYGRTGELGKARNLFQRACNEAAAGRLPRDRVILNSFLKACVVSGAMKEALLTLADVVAAVREQHTSEDSASQTSFSSPSPRKRERDEQRSSRSRAVGESSVIWPLGAGGLPNPLKATREPDVISYSTIIRGLARSENRYAGLRALELYREMRSLPVLDSHAANARRKFSRQRRRQWMSDQDSIAIKTSTVGSSRGSCPSSSSLSNEAQQMGILPDSELVDATFRAILNNEPPASGARLEGDRWNYNFEEGRIAEPVTGRLYDKFGWNQVDSSFPSLNPLNNVLKESGTVLRGGGAEIDRRVAAINEVVTDLRLRCGWSESEIERAKGPLMAAFAASLSETWRIVESSKGKEYNSGQEFNEQIDDAPNDELTGKLYDKFGWNEMDSGFKLF